MTQQPPTTSVRKITPADFEAVAALLGRAFDDDPVMNFLAKQDQHRSARIRHIKDMGLRMFTFPYGETYTGTNYEGAALWNPPGQIPHGLLFNLRTLPEMAKVTGIAGLPKALGALTLMEKYHPTNRPHYYLMAVGVDPSHQGKGVGTTLINHVLERVDRERTGAYLESSKAKNLPLYERLGFRVIEEVALPGGGPPFWPMWRDPQ
jgi:ribosomal protein S18 acetylase RimI-like enzyme